MTMNTVRVVMVAMPIDSLVLGNVGLVDGRVASLFYCVIPRLSSMAGW